MMELSDSSLGFSIWHRGSHVHAWIVILKCLMNDIASFSADWSGHVGIDNAAILDPARS